MREALTVKRLTQVYGDLEDTTVDKVIIVGELAELDADEFVKRLSSFSDPFHHATRIHLPGIDRNTLEIVPRDVGNLLEKVGEVLGDDCARGMFEEWLEAQAIKAGTIPPILEDTSIPAETEDPEQEGESGSSEDDAEDPG